MHDPWKMDEFPYFADFILKFQSGKNHHYCIKKSKNEKKEYAQGLRITMGCIFFDIHLALSCPIPNKTSLKK